MKETAFNLGKSVVTVMRGNTLSILIVHLVFIALGFALFTPLLGALSRLLLALSSTEVLADTDIIFFVLSPYGIITLVLFGAMLITILVFEQAAMMLTYIAAQKDTQEDIIRMIGYTAARALVIFKFSVLLIIRLLIIVLPFLAVGGAVAWLALTKYDINYYLAHKPPVFYLAALMIGAILLLIAFVVIRKLLSWSLTLPLILFGDTTPRQSFEKSAAIVSNHKKLVALMLIGWGVSIFILSILVFGLLQLLTNNIIPLFYHKMTLLLMVIGFLIALLVVSNFFITALASGSFAGLLVEMSHHFGVSTSIDKIGGARRTWQLRLTRARLIGASVATGLVSLLIGLWLLNSIQPIGDVTVVAHRGAAGRAPENTMAAVQAAIEDKTDWVEIDVQETADGQVIVVHDSDFMKLAGVDLKVWDGTLAEIQAIDVGSWFAKEYADQRTPTLIDVLKESKGKAHVVIELKYYGHDEQLEQRVIDIVEQLDMTEEIAIMSLKYDGVQKVRKLRPDWDIGLLSVQVLGNMGNLDVDFLAVNMAMATSTFIRSNQAAGKRVFVWTVNDKMSMFKMMSLGVDGIITDEPALARQVMAERSELNSVERLLIHAAVMLGKSLPQKEYRDQSP
ncbi:MAG: glycerophosphodiester phosphodiesterase [Desulfofustis sp.]|nr:glycerophosphodiester phosphodiesterase [Desulfofustis sp.]